MVERSLADAPAPRPPVLDRACTMSSPLLPSPSPPPVPVTDAEPSGALLYVWLPAAIVGNAFALFWLVRALQISQPAVGRFFQAAGLRHWLASWLSCMESHLPNSNCLRGFHAAQPQAGAEAPACASALPPALEHLSAHAASPAATDASVLAAPLQLLLQATNKEACLDLIDPASLQTLYATSRDIQPVMLEWCDVSCTRQTSSGSVQTLMGVSGRAQQGQMVAFLGSSGAGKPLCHACMRTLHACNQPLAASS